MPSLGSLWYNMGIRDLTDADLQKINAKFKNLGFDIQLTPKILKDITQSAVPKGIKIELDPAIKNEALARAVEGKTMRIAVTPLLTGFREAIAKATRENPPQAEVGVSEARLRNVIQNVLNKQGFLLNISTVNDNYSKVIQQKLNGTRYTVRIHADAKEITRSVQASLMQVQSRYFGLKVSRDILYRSIDEALGQKRFNINIAVSHDQARKAVQDALLRAQVMGKDQALAYQCLQTGEMKAAQAELLKLKAAQQDAASAAKAHATASVNLGGAMGRNITIAGELGSAMASIYSIHAAKEFLSQVIEIGGELEHQKIAMDTIFGDKGKTSELFGQIKGLARQSPFGVMELTKSVKALSAYGVQYNEIYDTAKRLADISAATSVDINRLILAFGKTKSRGFLDGLEAKQFAYANIPIYEMVRKKLEELEGQAVTTQQVMERMRKREISFDIVKDVLWDITDPGGKFYDMQEALAGSVKTSWKLVRDNIELMFGEIAESAVGNTLKSTAEILQGLTREWRTVVAVVGTAAIGLGVYKVAQIGVNQVMQQGTAKTYEGLMAEKQRDAQRLRSRSLLMELVATEKERLATVDQLTAKELRNAVANDALTLSQVGQLYATGKLNKAHILSLYHYGQIEKATAKAILSNNRLTVSLKGIGMAMASVGRAIGAFLFNPWTVVITAISGIVALWQRYNEQLDKSQEIGDNLFTRATESAKNLKAVLAEIGNEVEKLTDIKIAEAISKLETAIKDYSPTPEKTLREARVDNSGNVRSSQEYVKALKAEVEAMREAADLQEKIRIGDVSKNAMDNASGFFDDNLLKDLKDYAEAYADADKKIGKYLVDNKKQAEEMVAIALKADPAFKKEAESLETLGEKFTLLAQKQSKFSLAWKTMSKNFYDKETGIKSEYRDIWGIQLDWGNVGVGGLNGAKKEAFAELEQYMGYIKEELSRKSIEVGEGVDMSKPVQIMLANLGNTIFENIKSLPQDRQDELKEMWRTYFGLDFDDTVIFGDISENAKDGLDSLGKDLADKLRNGTTYNDLSDAEKEAVKKLIAESAQQTEKDMPHLTGKIKQALADESFIAKIAFSFGNYSGLDEWKQELIKIWGDGPEIVGVIESAPDVLSAYKALAELKKETDDWLSKFGLVKLPVGFKYQPGKLFTEDELNKVTDPIAKQLMQDANSHIGIVNDLNSGQKASGVNLSDFEKSKNKGRNKKDKFAEDLKQRFKDIQDAWSEFQKWSEVENKAATALRIGQSGLFSSLSEDQIPKTVEEYKTLLKNLIDDLKEAGINTAKRENLFNDLTKQLLDIDNSEAKEKLDRAKKKIDELIAETTSKWDLYKELFSATGDKQWSMEAAFSGDKQFIDNLTKDLTTRLNDSMAERGIEVEIPFILSEQEALDQFGKENGDLFNLWKTIRERMKKESVEAWKAEAKAMQDFLKEYGTFQERRLAMEEEYAEKIAEARSKGNIAQARLLERQRDSAKSKLEVDAIKQSIDWGSVFGNFGTIFKEQLEPTIQKLRTISQSDEFRHTNLQEQKGLYDLIEKLESANTTWDGKIFKTLGEDLVAYQNSMRNLFDAQKKERVASEDLAAAKERLKKAEDSGNSAAISSVRGDVKVAQSSFAKASDKVREFSANVQDAIGNLRNSSTQANNMFNQLAGSIAGLKSGSLQGVGDSLMDLDKLFNNGAVTNAVGGALSKGLSKLLGNTSIGKSLASALGNSGLIGQIISAILSILDILKEGIGALVSSLIDTVLGAVAGILKTIFNGKAFVQIGNAIKDGIVGILDAITLGGFSSWFDTSNAKEVRATIERLTERNELLTQSIDALRDTMRRYSSSRTIADARKAIELQKESDRNRLEIAKTQAGYHGSHHSWEYYWGGFSEEQITRLSAQIGREWSGDIWELSPEEMKALMSNVDMWEQIKNTGKGGYGHSVAEYLKDYADQANAITELNEQLAETLTGMSFDEVYDNFVDLLSNMETSAEDFADNVSEYFFKAMLSKKIGDLFGEKLEAWYDKFAKAVEDDTINDAAVRDGLMNEYMGFVNEGIDWRDKLAQATGYTGDSQQKSGLSAGIQSVTEDTADLLASYLNGIRGDVSVQTHVLWPKLLDDALPQMNVIAQSQLDAQRQIAENTLRNAVAAEAIMKSSDEINRRLARVTQGGEKFYVH